MAPLSFRLEQREREKISCLNSTSLIAAGDLSTQSLNEQKYIYLHTGIQPRPR